VSWFRTNVPPDEAGVPEGGAIVPMGDLGGERAPVVDPAAGGGGVPTMAQRTGGGVSDAAVQAILQKYPATNDGMRAAMSEIDQTFGPGTIKLLEHPQRLDKLVMPDGRTIDAMVGAGAPGATWGWQVEGAHGGGATIGSFGGGMAPQGVGPLIGSPMAGRPLIDDPSYQFRMSEAIKALDRSAAGKGTLLTGGAAKQMARYVQDYAGNEFQNSYARAASEQGNNFNRLYSMSTLGLQGTNANQQLQSGYAGNVASTQIGQGNVQAGATQIAGEANANTIGALGGAATDWARRYYGGRPAVPDIGTSSATGQGFYGIY
jgi:hypothetical protein